MISLLVLKTCAGDTCYKESCNSIYFQDSEVQWTENTQELKSWLTSQKSKQALTFCFSHGLFVIISLSSSMFIKSSFNSRFYSCSTPATKKTNYALHSSSSNTKLKSLSKAFDKPNKLTATVQQKRTNFIMSNPPANTNEQ